MPRFRSCRASGCPSGSRPGSAARRTPRPPRRRRPHHDGHVRCGVEQRDQPARNNGWGPCHSSYAPPREACSSDPEPCLVRFGGERAVDPGALAHADQAVPVTGTVDCGGRREFTTVALRRPAQRRTATSGLARPACLSTFVSASCTTRYAAGWSPERGSTQSSRVQRHGAGTKFPSGSPVQSRCRRGTGSSTGTSAHEALKR